MNTRMKTTHGLPELPVWLGVCLIALAMYIGQLVDSGPPEIEAAQAVAADKAEAIETAVLAAAQP